jgi:hypothetical protein
MTPKPGSVLAPAVGYGPDVLANQLALQNQLRTYQNQMMGQALLNSLLAGGGQTGGQSPQDVDAAEASGAI